MTETEIVKKLIENDEDTFRFLISKYHLNIFKVCMGFLHHKEDAEDVAQEVFIEVFHSVKNFKAESKLSTWIYRIAVTKSLDVLQKRKTRRLFNDLQRMVNLKALLFDSSDPHRKLETKENANILFKTVNNLPENQRIAYTLAKYDELSYEEIAHIMNTSLSSV